MASTAIQPLSNPNGTKCSPQKCPTVNYVTVGTIQTYTVKNTV